MQNIKHFNAAVTQQWPVQVDDKGVETRVDVSLMSVWSNSRTTILSVVKRFKATGATADKTTPCRRKLVRVKRVVEAVKKRISRNPRRSRINPVLVPPSFRLVMYAEDGNIRVCACSCDWNTFPRTPWNFEAVSYRFLIKQFFRWVNLYGTPCT